METAEAQFLKKHIENKYKENVANDKGIESFAFRQIISACLDVDYLNRGMYRLNNYSEIEKQRLEFKKRESSGKRNKKAKQPK